MIEMGNNHIIRVVGDILCDSCRISTKEKENFASFFTFEKIYADGSLRNFLRVKRKDDAICIAVYPPEPIDEGLAEARSTINIGSHLYKKGVPVPEIFGSNNDLGLIVFEDCGDVRLFDLLIKKSTKDRFADEETQSHYIEVIEKLVHMQIRGAENFRLQWCYDTPEYNQEVMIKKESEYFLNSFWYDLMEGEACEGVEEEFKEIAEQAAQGMNGFFLHRDFQCRNIMVAKDGVRIIDFQAGRFGPPGYDLASLLIDPYSRMTESFREEMLNNYLFQLGAFLDFDTKDFRRQFSYLALQRNLQILGAFSFLSKRRCKPFFKDFIIPSLNMLIKRLSENEMKPYFKLRAIAEMAGKSIGRVI